jgi:hypothetical protein
MKTLPVQFESDEVNVPVKKMSEDRYEMLMWAESCETGDRSAADYR